MNILEQTVDDHRKTHDGRIIQGASHTSVILNHKHRNKIIVETYAHIAKLINKQDLYFDAAGRSIVMFSGNQVDAIRRLAADARRAGVGNTELESLVAMALNTELDELLLEIEARDSEQKLGSEEQFPERLCQALREVEYQADESDRQRRLKRAVFIKYVKRLKGGR